MCMKLQLFGGWGVLHCLRMCPCFGSPAQKRGGMLFPRAFPLLLQHLRRRAGLSPGPGSSGHGGDIAWAHAKVRTSPRGGQDGHLHPIERWPAFGQGNICFPYSDLLLGELLPKPR